MTSSVEALTTAGLVLIGLGIILVLLPFLLRAAPQLESVHPLLLYVYRADGFTFATSPILILATVGYLLYLWLR